MIETYARIPLPGNTHWYKIRFCECLGTSEEFGILSPPVASLINLSWVELEDQTNYYDRYLAVLAGLRSHGGREMVAHADMALWAAAHHFVLPDSARLVEQMYADDYFREGAAYKR